MVYDKPPFCNRSKVTWSEWSWRLGGISPWCAATRRAWAQFPAIANANGIDIDKIKVEPVGFSHCEPMLAEGKVDSVTGFSFSSYLNLVRLGVPEDDITTILMADHGLQLYGNAVIANTEFRIQP